MLIIKFYMNVSITWSYSICAELRDAAYVNER